MTHLIPFFSYDKSVSSRDIKRKQANKANKEFQKLDKAYAKKYGEELDTKKKKKPTTEVSKKK